MKQSLLISFLLITTLAYADLPEFYHDYDETIAVLDSLQQLRPDIIHMFIMGYSQQDSIEIWAVKLSDNVMIDEDEPRLLFVGQGHAEENIGVEIVIEFLSDVVNRYYLYHTHVEQTEIFLIPTLNPEGFKVVFGQGSQVTEPDLSYRKNKRDNVGDGVFRYVYVGLGGDTSGVDFNRNFDFNWIHGDTLYQTGHDEFNDYYRGPYPFSESENAALRDLAYEKHFAMGIIYHQSRSTNFSEKVIYPWNWGASGKLPPDQDIIQNIGIELSQKMQKQGSGNPYEPNLSGSKYGNSHDYFYHAMGSFIFTVETSDIQPTNYNTMMNIVEDNIDGMIYLIDRARGYSGLPSRGQLTGVVLDSSTGLPLEARVEIIDRQSGILLPRMTDPLSGRYRRYLLNGQYSIEVSNPGYAVKTVNNITVTQSGAATVNIQLAPLPMFNVSGEIVGLPAGEPVDAVIYFYGAWCDTIEAAGGLCAAELPQGDYSMRIDADEYVSWFENIDINSDTSIFRELSPGVVIFSDEFESGSLSQWTTEGSPVWTLDYSDTTCNGTASLSDSPGMMYEIGQMNSVAASIDLTGQLTAHLQIWHKYYLEPEYDFGYIEVSIDGNNWETLEAFDLQDIDWHEARFDLTPYCGNDIQLKFSLEADGTLEEPGWNIDDVKVAASNVYSEVSENRGVPYEFYLAGAYPNPFNSAAIIRYSLDKPGYAELKVFNIMGQEAAVLLSGETASGLGIVRWQADRLPSGIYFIRLRTNDKTAVVKTMLLK